LEHLTNPTETLKKLHKILKKGGFLLLSAPFEESNIAEHIIEAPIDFYNNGGYNFLKTEFIKRHHFSWQTNINAVYEKRGA
jgi:2-polyprenyl-3-methyl-5-hydroxy-6-metoxy-1,4-benzoquinol methylase